METFETNSFFKHKLSDVQATKIGKNTTIWQFVTVLSGATIGNNVNICANCFVENDVTIGDRVTIKSGVQVWDGVTIENDVFVGPNVSFTNDRFPRSKNHPSSFSKTIVKQGASLGAGAVILPGIEIGANAMIGAGAVVTKSVPPNAIVKGNPARITGYVNAPRDDVDFSHELSSQLTSGDKKELPVHGVFVKQFWSTSDARGRLAVGNAKEEIPFSLKRFFLVFDVPSSEIRGEHAHRECEQFLVCVAGECSIILDDGQKRCEVRLNDATKGIYIPPMVWAVQYKHTSDAVLLVFASHPYDETDYIRSYSEFQQLIESK